MTALNKKPAAKPAAKSAPAKAAAPAKKTAPAKKAGAKPAAKPAAATWDAPADFRPAFYSFTVKTDPHGLIDPRFVKGSRYKGRWDSEDPKSVDLAEFDQKTLMGFAMRLSAIGWAPNALKRIPADTVFTFIVRTGVNKETGALRARIIAVAHKAPGAKKTSWFEDKTDPVYRRLRRVARVLPSVFVDCQLLPSLRKSKKAQEADEE